MPHRFNKAKAASRLEFIPQRFNPLVLKVMHGFLPILLRLRLRPWLPSGIARIQVVHGERLVKLYQQFQAGEIRFLMAFRHPEVDDPLCMAYLLSRGVPQAAQQIGISLRSPIHSHFIYDRGMTLWAGNWLGWFFSRLGGIPIHRGKRLDRVGLRAARELFVNGLLPLAVAPEGATNGHSGVVSPLEPGVAQLGFWCVEDLQKANRDETVWIVPIGIQYHYPHPPWQQLDLLLTQLESESGLTVQPVHSLVKDDPTTVFYPRLLRLAEHILTQMETFYHRCYRIPLPERPFTDPNGSPNQILAQRLSAILDIALQVAERHFGLIAEGTVIDRCRRLEEASWKDIYREDISDLRALSSLERGLADWTAQESFQNVLHMRLAESFVAVTGNYIADHPTVERFAETSLILFDLIARIKGIEMPARPRLGLRHATVTIGEPISVSDRWTDYTRDRGSAKQAIAVLTQDLQVGLESLLR